MKNARRLLSVLLALVLILGLAACGAKDAAPTSEAPAAEAPKADAPAAEAPAENKTEAKEYPAYVTGPITIQFQHTFGSGVNYEHLAACVEEFNNTNQYGITVEESYGGNYTELQTKLMTDIPAGNNPVLAVQAMTGILPLSLTGAFTDMTPYMERDNWDPDNIVDAIRDISVPIEGQFLAMPFIRSAYVFGYNKEIYDQMGFEPPTSFEELIEQSKAIYEKLGIPGHGVSISAGGNQEQLYRSAGNGVGYLDDDGLNSSITTNGSFLKVATVLREGIDEGYFMTPSAGVKIDELFFNGEIASMIHSTANVGKFTKNASFYAVSRNVEFGGYGTALGGGALVIVGANHDEQEIAAAWEFIKFMMSDEIVARTNMNTGYVPITKSVANSPELQAFWEENPGFKVAYDCLNDAYPGVFSERRADWTSACDSTMQYILQEKSMTPEEGNAYLEEQRVLVFGN